MAWIHALLLSMGQVDPTLLDRLQSADLGQREEAISKIEWPQLLLSMELHEILTNASGNIHPLLKSAKPDIRRRAAGILGTLQVQSAATDIVPLLQDSEPAVRGAAARALADLDARGKSPLLMPLLDDPDPTVRDEGIRALARLGEKGAIPAATRMLDDKVESFRIAGLVAIGNLRSEESIPSIVRLLRGDTSMVRFMAVNTLGELDAKDVNPIIELLDDPDGLVKQGAIKTLGQLGDLRAAPGLRVLLNAPNLSIRRKAVEALGDLRDRDSVEPLVGLLGHAGTRPFAAEALAAIEAREAIPKLILTFKDSEGDARVRIAAALARLGSDEGVTTLINAKASLFVLNALRTPDSWGKLRDLKLSRDLRGSRRFVCEGIAKEAGLRFEVVEASSYAAKVYLQRTVSFRSTSRSESVGDVLEKTLYGFLPFRGHELILDGNIIRLVPNDEAQRFWQFWWAQRQLEKK